MHRVEYVVFDRLMVQAKRNSTHRELICSFLEMLISYYATRWSSGFATSPWGCAIRIFDVRNCTSGVRLNVQKSQMMPVVRARKQSPVARFYQWYQVSPVEFLHKHTDSGAMCKNHLSHDSICISFFYIVTSRAEMMYGT